MANKRIKDLTNTATEADLVSGNYLALDGSAGTKKIAGNAIAKKSEGTSEIRNLSTTASEADLVSGNYIAIDGSAGAKKLPAEIFGKIVGSIDPLAKSSEFTNIPVDTYEQGNLDAINGLEAPATNRVRSEYIACAFNRLSVTAKDNYKYRIVFYTRSSIEYPFSYISTASSTSWNTYSNVFDVPATAVAFRVVFANVDDSDLTPSDVDVSIFGEQFFNGFSQNLMTPNSSVVVSTTRLMSTPRKVDENGLIAIVEVDSGYKWRISAFSDISCSNTSRLSGSESYDTTWQTGNGLITLPTTTKYYVVSLAKADDSTISVSDSIHIKWQMTFESNIAINKISHAKNYEKINVIPFKFYAYSGFIQSGYIASVYESLFASFPDTLLCEIKFWYNDGLGGGATLVGDTGWMSFSDFIAVPSTATFFFINLKKKDGSSIDVTEADISLLSLIHI